MDLKLRESMRQYTIHVKTQTTAWRDSVLFRQPGLTKPEYEEIKSAMDPLVAKFNSVIAECDEMLRNLGNDDNWTWKGEGNDG